MIPAMQAKIMCENYIHVFYEDIEEAIMRAVRDGIYIVRMTVPCSLEDRIPEIQKYLESYGYWSRTKNFEDDGYPCVYLFIGWGKNNV